MLGVLRLTPRRRSVLGKLRFQEPFLSLFCAVELHLQMRIFSLAFPPFVIQIRELLGAFVDCGVVPITEHSAPPTSTGLKGIAVRSQGKLQFVHLHRQRLKPSRNVRALFEKLFKWW